MTEELTPQSEETPEEEVQSPEEIAKAFLKEKGIDPDEFDFKEAANLQDWKRNLNKKSSELGAIAKQLEAAPKPAEPSPADEFDPKELDTLKKALKAIGVDPDNLKSSLGLVAQNVEEERASIAEEFFASHDEVTPDEVIGQLVSDGVNLDTITPARLKKELTRAAKVIKAEKFDIEAEVEKRLTKKLEELSQDGTPVAIKKGRAAASGGHKSLEEALADPNTSFWDKLDLASK